MNGALCPGFAAADERPEGRQGLCVAAAAGDERLLRVIGSYFLEDKTFARCDGYRRGRTLLDELRRERRFDALLVDEQLLDMDALEFLETLGREKLRRPPVFVMLRRGRPALCERLLAGGVAQCFFKPCSLAGMTRRILLLTEYPAAVRAGCARLCRAWGVQEDAANCAYLADAVLVAAGLDEGFAFGKEVAAAVGELHGVSQSAVESGLRRLIAHMERNSTADYRKFCRAAVPEGEKMTPDRLVRAVKRAVRPDCEKGEALCNA